MFAFMTPPAGGPTAWTLDEVRAFGEQNLRHARQIAAGSHAVALEYARDWYAHFQPSYFENANDVDRKRMIDQRAYEVRGIAPHIVADGRPHYVKTIDGRDHLVFCWLTRGEGEKKNIGYAIWCEVAEPA